MTLTKTNINPQEKEPTWEVRIPLMVIASSGDRDH